MSELYLQRSAAVAFRRLGEECIVMSATNSTLFNLNEVATVIWESADGLTPLSEIVRRDICKQFEVAAEEALSDAEEFIRTLAEHDILIVSEQPVLNRDREAGDSR